MTGRIAVGFIVVAALIAGAALWWLQEYAFYDRVAFAAGAEILLTPAAGGPPEPIPVEGVTGIDATSSPIRFRACFRTSLPLAVLSETYAPYPAAVPLVAPRWFACFDAAMIGAALERGEARAFLSEAQARRDVDRVVAVFPDGRGFAWTQLAPGAAR
ncbi:MAG: DUF6446 family protein [Gemmobacter sp.]